MSYKTSKGGIVYVGGGALFMLYSRQAKKLTHTVYEIISIVGKNKTPNQMHAENHPNRPTEVKIFRSSCLVWCALQNFPFLHYIIILVSWV